MWLFFFGFAAGSVSVLAAMALFVSWAISGAEKSLAEDIESRENDIS